MTLPESKVMSWKNIVFPSAEEFSGRIAWLDFLKGFSMIAVVVDHLCYSLDTRGTPSPLQPLTFFSVSMFIFLASITAALSYDRHRDAGVKGVSRRMLHIFIPYAIATAVYLFFQLSCGFDLRVYFRSLLFFSASMPFYFVFFFLQLMLVSPLLYWGICVRHRKDHIIIPIVFLAVAAVGFWSGSCTEMLPLPGGGRRLFGGTFLILFALGFLFYRFRTVLESFPAVLLLAGVFSGLYILFSLFWRPALGVLEKTRMSANPPGLYMFLYMFMIFWGIRLLFKLIDFARLRKFTRPVSAVFDALVLPVGFCGKHSLMIYLYHMLAIGILLVLVQCLSVETFMGKLFFNLFALFFATAFPLFFAMAGALWNQCIRFLSAETNRPCD